MWIIYKHTFPNNKVYIGLTKQDVKQRWRNGNGYQNCPTVWKAIQKYGWKNIKSEIIEDNIFLIEEANKQEQYWIKYYNSYINWENSNGYNATIGGDGYSIIDYNTLYEDWKNGLSNKEITKKYSICRDTVTNMLNSFNIPEEERVMHRNKEISKSLKYFDDNEILQLWNLGFTYSEISKKLNCGVDTIRRALDKQKISKEIRKERIRIQQSLNPKSCNKKKVIQYSLEGQYIQTFLSIAEANRYLNLPVNNSNISQVCKGKRKTAYGHKWKYAD